MIIHRISKGNEYGTTIYSLFDDDAELVLTIECRNDLISNDTPSMIKRLYMSLLENKKGYICIP